MESVTEHVEKYFYTKPDRMGIIKVTRGSSIRMEEVISNDSTEKRCDGFTGSESEKVREQAFEQLENLRRKAPQIDYERELASYREEKYGTANFG